METNRFILGLVAVMSLLSGCADGAKKCISENELRSKIYGAWAGKVIGVQYGQPHEFWYLGRINEGELPWTDEMVEGAVDQDDIYTQISFLQTFDEYGLDADALLLAEGFAKAGFTLCHANLQARKNWFDGLRPPLTGSALYNAHADDIDFQIDADFIGLMCPGMPVMVQEYCDRIGPIMSDGDGIYGGVYIATMHSMAFFESDIPTIVAQALANIPPGSSYARCISDVLACYRKDPSDWRAAWQMLHDNWEDHICTPDHLFDIDAKINGAYVTIGLLYGGDDFARTMEIAVRCGQDADCNASNAAAVWGAVHVLDAIPQEYRRSLKFLEDKPFAYTRYTYQDAAGKTLDFARQNILRGGGREIAEGTFRVKRQRAGYKAPLRESFSGMRFVRSYHATDSAWQYSGSWERVNGWGEDILVRSEEPGARAKLEFEGQMVVLTGLWGPEYGVVDVYIDGVLQKKSDCWWSYECGLFDTNRQVLFVAPGLAPGRHVLELVVSKDKNPSSGGHRITVVNLDTYAPAS